MEKGRKQGVLGRNKEKQNNNKNTFHLPRQNSNGKDIMDGSFLMKNKMIFFRFYLTKAEFCGLTLKDIDLEKRTINVNHQLQYVGNKGKYTMMSYQWEKCFQHVVEKYNRIYRVQLICRNIEIFNGTYRYKCYLKCVYTP